VFIDQILPDAHRVAAPRQFQLDHLPVRFTGSGGTLASLFRWCFATKKPVITSLAGFELSAAVALEKPVITSLAGFELSEPVVTEVAAFEEPCVPNRREYAVLSRLTSDSRQPSRDELCRLLDPPQRPPKTSQRDHLFPLLLLKTLPMPTEANRPVEANVSGHSLWPALR